MKRKLLVLALLIGMVGMGATFNVGSLQDEDFSTTYNSDSIRFQASYFDQTISYRDVLIPTELQDDLKKWQVKSKTDGLTVSEVQVQYEFDKSTGYSELNGEKFDSKITFDKSGDREFKTKGGVINVTAESHYEHLVLNYESSSHSWENVFSGQDTDKLPVSGNVLKYEREGEYQDRVSLTYDNLYDETKEVTVVVLHESERPFRGFESSTGRYEDVSDTGKYFEIQKRATEQVMTNIVPDNGSKYSVQAYNVTVPADSQHTFKAFTKSPKGVEQDMSMYVLGSFAGGSGTSSDPYQIDTCQQLQDVQNNLSSSFELTSDVDCTGFSFSTIGDNINPFNGVLNGQGYVVKNLTIDINQGAAMFYRLSDTGTVENIGISGLNITGDDNIGAIATISKGTIRDVFVKGEINAASDAYGVGGVVGQVDSGKINNTYVDIDITGGTDSVGGIAGGMTTTNIYNTYNIGDITDTTANAGAIVGQLTASDAGSSAFGCYSGTDAVVYSSYARNNTNYDSLVGVKNDGFDSGSCSGGDAKTVNSAMLSPEEMKGDSASTNMDFDFINTWSEVTSATTNSTDVGYPILQDVSIQEQYDAQGLSYVDTNSAPTADYSYSPSSPAIGETISFDGSTSSDPDGDTLTYEWDWDNDGTYEGSGQTASHSYSSSGSYDVTLRVDDGSATDTQTQTITVSDQTNPTVTNLAPTGRITTQTPTITADLGDNEDLSSYTIDIDGTQVDSGSVTGTSASVSYTTSQLSYGSHTYTVTATDSAGNTASSSDSFTVNEPPTADYSYTPNNPAIGESISFDGTLSTDDDTISNYEWDWTSDGTYENTGSTQTHSYSSAGNYDVTLRVTDSDGVTDTTTQTVSVTDQTNPSASNLNPTDGILTSSSSVTFSGDVSDNSDLSQVELFVDSASQGTQSVTGTTDTFSFSQTLTDGGHNWYVVVTDTAGNTYTTTTRSLTVDSTSPSYSNLNPADGSVLSDATPTISGDVSDNNDLSEVEVFVDGSSVTNITATGTADSFSYTTTTTLTEGSHTFQIEVRDTAGNTVQSTQRTITVDTTNPSATNLAPTGRINDQTLTISADASDNIELSSYTVSVDSTQVDSGSLTGTSDSISYTTSSLSYGSHSYTVEVTDSAGNTASSSDTFTVNEPPTADYTYSPSSPAIGETINFDGSTSSDDTGITSYEWDWDNDGTYEATGVTASHSYSSAGSYDVTLRVTDDDGTTDTTTQTISVTDQTNPSITIDVPTGRINDRTPYINASFSDNVELSNFTLELDSSVVDSGNLAGVSDQHSYQTTQLSYGQHTYTWKVEDSSGNIATVSETFTVNEPPTANFSYSPSNPNVQENIDFDASNSTDDDSISTYEWDWTNDGFYDATGQLATVAYGSPGTYTVKLKVTDSGGLTDTTTKTVTVTDETDPTYSNLQPADGATVTTPYTISGDVSDNNWLKEVRLYDSSGNLLNSKTYNSISGSFSFSLSQDISGWYIEVEDSAGNIATSTTRSITVDNDPTADFTYSPSNPSIGETINFDGTTSSDDISISSYEWDWTNDGTYDSTGSTPTHSYSTSGTYTVKLKVTDSSGQTSTTTKSVTVSDNTPPTVSNLEPAGGAYLQSLDVSGVAEDSQGISEVRLYIDGSLQNTKSAGGVSSYSFSFTPSLTDGSYNWYIEAEDINGNVYTSNTRSVTIDTDTPTYADFYSPDFNDGDIVGTDFPTIYVAEPEDATDSTLTVEIFDSQGNSEVLNTGVQNSTLTTGGQVNLEEGSNSFYAEIRDSAGNTATTGTLSVTYDNTPPSLTNAKVLEAVSLGGDNVINGVTSDGSPTFEIDADDADGIGSDQLASARLLINGTEYYSVSSPTSTTLSTQESLTEGYYEFTWEATDEAGNTETFTANVEIDQTEPQFDFDARMGATMDDVDLIAENFSEKPESVTFSPEGKSDITITSAPYEATITYNTDGEYTINATAVDEAGNEQLEQDTIRIDTQPAEITDTSVSQTIESDGNDVTVNYLVSDNIELDNVDVYWEGNLVKTNQHSGTFAEGSYTRTGVAEGTYSVTLEPEDWRGQGFNETLSIFVDRTAPKLTNLDVNASGPNPDRAKWNSTYTVQVNATDNNGINYTEVQLVADEALTDYVRIDGANGTVTIDPTNYYSDTYLKNRGGEIRANVQTVDNVGNSDIYTNRETGIILDNTVSFYDWSAKGEPGTFEFDFSFKSDDNLTQIDTDIFLRDSSPALNFSTSGLVSCGTFGNNECLDGYNKNYTITVENPLKRSQALVYNGEVVGDVPADGSLTFYTIADTYNGTVTKSPVVDINGVVDWGNFKDRFSTRILYDSFGQGNWTQSDKTWTTTGNVPSAGSYLVELNLKDDFGNQRIVEKQVRVRPDTMLGRFYQNLANSGINPLYAGLFMIFIVPIASLWQENKNFGSTIFTKGVTVAWCSGLLLFGVLESGAAIVAMFTAAVVVANFLRNTFGGS